MKSEARNPKYETNLNFSNVQNKRGVSFGDLKFGFV